MTKGKFIYEDGRIYEGDFVDEKMTKGKMIYGGGNIFKDGDIYEGDL